LILYYLLSVIFQKYKTEAKERWGESSAYKEFEDRTKNHTEDRWNDLAKGMDCIMAEFAVCMKNKTTPDSTQAAKIRRFIL